jgi:predicted metal-binding protein
MPHPTTTLFLCRICGQTKPTDGSAKPTNPAAQRLYDDLHTALAEKAINVQLTDCLSVCTQPLAWALSAEGKHTMAFAAREEIPSAQAFAELAQGYAATPMGEKFKKSDFPPEMKGTLISRVPPLPKV